LVVLARHSDPLVGTTNWCILYYALFMPEHVPAEAWSNVDRLLLEAQRMGATIEQRRPPEDGPEFDGEPHGHLE
jgi:hypothetical protein